MDVSRYARFERPGHAVTGDRSPRWRKSTHSQRLVGYDFAHAIVERALAFYAEQGVTAKRLMTDNAFANVNNRSLRELLAREGIRHLRTEPYRPRTNGKVERFHQTMVREWAYGVVYRSHRQRNQALPHWLEHEAGHGRCPLVAMELDVGQPQVVVDDYNARRPHSSLGDRPPISRVHNVRERASATVTMLPGLCRWLRSWWRR